MLTMSIPPAVPQTEQIMLMQADKKQVRQEFDYVLSACQEVEQEGEGRAGALNVLTPGGELSRAIRSRHHDVVVSPEIIRPTIQLLQDAQEGKLLKIEYWRLDKRHLNSYVFRGDDGSVPTVPPDTKDVRYLKENAEVYYYKPEPDYFGKDQAVFSAEYKGRRYKIVLDILVQDMIEQSDAPSPCPEPILIRTKKKVSEQPNRSDFSNDFYSYAGIEFYFDSLPGTAVAQTTGEGADATITLDTDAAGHGWFVDSTPQDNSEYLPTSNPNQWIAREGTEAANKMDLLSVLLHEYGHALGISHSADGHDYMAATLAPGIRRLPSSEELSLMAQLAGQARLALEGVPADTPNPALPLSALGFALIGRLRRTDYGAWTLDAQSAQLFPQKQIAINATLNPLPKNGRGGGKWRSLRPQILTI